VSHFVISLSRLSISKTRRVKRDVESISQSVEYSLVPESD